MSDELQPETAASEPVVYQIRVRSHLGHEWAEWFGGLAITPELNGDTLLTGPVADQPALHGLFKKLRDLGMPLLSVSRIETEQAMDQISRELLQ